MKGLVKRVAISSDQGAFYLDVYDCGRTIVNVWTGRVLKAHRCKTGYYRVWVTATDRKRKSFRVCRLVAMAHLEYLKNYNELDVNHKDGDKGNNDCDNLEWVTKSENQIHAYENGLFKTK
jgi:hypothetical protein